MRSESFALQSSTCNILLISSHWHHLIHFSVPSFSCKLEFRFCLLAQSCNLARMAQRQCGIHPLGEEYCMVVPIFVEQADTGAHAYSACVIWGWKWRYFHSIYASSFIRWNSLMRHFPNPLFGNQCYSLCAKHRITVSFFPLLTKFSNNESISLHLITVTMKYLFH